MNLTLAQERAITLQHALDLNLQLQCERERLFDHLIDCGRTIARLEARLLEYDTQDLVLRSDYERVVMERNAHLTTIRRLEQGSVPGSTLSQPEPAPFEVQPAEQGSGSGTA